MLQQTQVDRVLPAYDAVARAVAGTGRPRRGNARRCGSAVGTARLSAAGPATARRCAAPWSSGTAARCRPSYDDLRALPGIGDYTAAAVASFAFGQRHAVLDTNVRRVLGRLVGGEALPRAGGDRPRAERARRRCCRRTPLAPRWAVATMELGALVCTARSAACIRCPVADLLRLDLAGRPAYDGPRASPPGLRGTDRQARGRLLAVLRDAPGPVAGSTWPPRGREPVQQARALASLVADGLVEACRRTASSSCRAGSHRGDTRVVRATLRRRVGRLGVRASSVTSAERSPHELRISTDRSQPGGHAPTPPNHLVMAIVPTVACCLRGSGSLPRATRSEVTARPRRRSTRLDRACRWSG